MARSKRKTTSQARRRPRKIRRLGWTELPDSALLGLRFCDLELKIRGTALETCLTELERQLARRSLRLRPHCWLSTEWFSPDGVPGFAIPFYLAHPRLTALEHEQMGEVEGGTVSSCMQLLRHEAAHALDSAFGLHRRADWRETFGAWSTPYVRHYRPKPYSRRFVRNLDRHYAQSHPAEDFAETFAVWLDPASRWRSRYRGWGALEKLRYIDRVMHEIAGKRPRVTLREEVEPLSEITTTLGEYYERKRKRYGGEVIRTYDRDLVRMFAPRAIARHGESVAEFLRRTQPRIRLLVARSTGEPVYAIDRVLLGLIRRSAALDLVVPRDRTGSARAATQRIALRATKYLKSGYDQFAR